MYDEYGGPSEALVMDWSEHNDHADNLWPDNDPPEPEPTSGPETRRISPHPIAPSTYDAITEEVVRAIAKHGLTHSPINPATPPGECLAMLVEEVGEVAHALTYDANPDALDSELVQVAAVAAMWLQARADARQAQRDLYQGWS